jgi:predicted dehydrogenase/threonine dehydrogenase-like Zn-dependent dehydrogenase
MKQVIIKQGQALVMEIPAPQVEEGTVLVQVSHSCISVGTEMSGIRASGTPLWRRAFKQPEKLQKALKMVVDQGLTETYSQIRGTISTAAATGYSAAGEILEVGPGISDLQPGDRVACAGAQCAHHAEIIRVPRNLVAPIPKDLDFAQASTVTLGAIALQGLRRLQPTLGEAFVIIGLGILGQLTVQMLKANGCRVIGVDLSRDRINLAQSLGLDLGVHPEDGDEVEQVARLTGGAGADGVIISAATPSHVVVSTAFKMCRKKGRVVLVGDVGLNLNREDFYVKELDFFISTSYGPGRYDRAYEEKGCDYPLAYVRWTENRNMGEYLRLLAGRQVNIDALLEAVYPIDEASQAYGSLSQAAAKPLVLLAYPGFQEHASVLRLVANEQAKAAGPDRIRLAVVGAGAFAKGVHLPNLRKLSDRYHVQAIMSHTGHNAIAAAQMFGANYATTDFQQVLADPEIDAVLIATRHHLHAAMSLEALRAGKHVLVEKPLALTPEELEEIEAFYRRETAADPGPVLLTGFNRRFSRFARRIKAIIQGRNNPMILNYRMNAGYIPLDHWVHTAEGGGRNLGEACHIYDLFTFFTESWVTRVEAQALQPQGDYYSPRDNFVATVSFADGSVATLTYTALGSPRYPKEQLEIFVDGKVLVLDNYQSLKIFGAKLKGVESKGVDKGQKEELEALAFTIQHGGEWPIPLWQQVQATKISFAVEDKLSRPVASPGN